MCTLACQSKLVEAHLNVFSHHHACVLQKEAYESIPVIAEKYPTIEQLEAVDPDFVYASYGSAFRNRCVI